MYGWVFEGEYESVRTVIAIELKFGEYVKASFEKTVFFFRTIRTTGLVSKHFFNRRKLICNFVLTQILNV